LRSRTR